MAEENKKPTEEKKAPTGVPESEKAKPVEKEEPKEEKVIVRILASDIRGSKSIYSGLTNIKGVSWAFSNAICNTMGIDKNRKISDLKEEEIQKISEFIKNPQVPEFLLNRRKDYDTGEDKHLVGSDLDLRKEFDIKRLRKIRCYRGMRHATGQPSRGQRTKAHFRENKTVGVVGKKKRGNK